MKQRYKKQSGFTIVELIVVMAILALLAGIAGPRIMQVFSGANTKAVKLQIKDLENSLDLYRLDIGHYPTDAEGGLKALVKGSGARWNGPYLKGKSIPLDSWGFTYHYANPSQHGGKFDVYSYGADNQAGGDGEDADITSWE